MKSRVFFVLLSFCAAMLWGCSHEPLKDRIQGAWRDDSQGTTIIFDLQAEPPSITALEDKEDGRVREDSLSLDTMRFDEKTDSAMLSGGICVHMFGGEIYFDIHLEGTGKSSIMHLLVYFGDEDEEKDKEKAKEYMLHYLPDYQPPSAGN